MDWSGLDDFGGLANQSRPVIDIITPGWLYTSIPTYDPVPVIPTRLMS